MRDLLAAREIAHSASREVRRYVKIIFAGPRLRFRSKCVVQLDSPARLGASIAALGSSRNADRSAAIRNIASFGAEILIGVSEMTPSAD
jgi:hypothetical protein